MFGDFDKSAVFINMKGQNLQKVSLHNKLSELFVNCAVNTLTPNGTVIKAPKTF